MKTFADLIDTLKREDEVTLLEVLGISSSELVDLIESYIFDKQETIWNYYNEDPEELDWEEVAYKS